MTNLESIMADYEKKLTSLRDERDSCAADTESWHGIAVRIEKDRDAMKKRLDEAEWIIAELVATIRGECSSLLDSSRGGSVYLTARLEEFLASKN